MGTARSRKILLRFWGQHHHNRHVSAGSSLPDHASHRPHSQKKLFLLGHSWGSVLGLTYAADHPEMLHAYIGCGQVVNMKKSCRLSYDFAAAHAGPRALERLKHTDCTYTGENWLDDLLFVTGQVVKHGGSLYGRSNYNDLIYPLPVFPLLLDTGFNPQAEGESPVH